jgi:hypothetical protein
MRYTRIDVGDEAGNTATMTRAAGAEHIEVEFTVRGDTRRHQVAAADEEDRWSMAEILQPALDGRRGAGGDIRDYATALELLGC